MQYKNRVLSVAGAVALAAMLAACGGGGSSGSSVPSTGGGTPTPTASPTIAPSYTVSGTVTQIPNDAYGPASIGGVTYASSDATQTTALNGATVVVGPVPIVGATAPAALPSGDVSVTTNASGAFSATLSVAPGASMNTEPFVVPTNNVTNFAPPATGYYVEVFAQGTDGKSAGVPLPLHRFVSASSTIALHVTTATSAESIALTAVNTDRANNGAGPLVFDESAEEAARLHASDEASNTYFCHYDTHNVGPTSRYVNVGGVGLTGEGLTQSGSGVTSATAAFQSSESGFMSEKALSPQGGHYLNLVDVAHTWAGLAAFQAPNYPGGLWEIDYELVTASAQDQVVGSSGYPVLGSGTLACPTGTINNNS